MKFGTVCSTIKVFVFLMLSVLWSQGSSAQTTFSVEEYMVHNEGQGIPELEGMTTYRIYVDLENEGDFVSAIYGGNESPFSISVAEPMFNSPFVTGGTSGGVISMLTSYFPEVAFDSWLTIGLESAPSSPGQMDVSVLESADQPFIASFVSGSDRDGLGFEISDEMGGAWFVLNGTTNGYAGEDLRVLVMQITCASVPSGTLNAQVVPAGNSTDSNQIQQGFNGTEVWDLLPPAAVGGCTDPDACNYDEFATEDDGTCTYETCEGCTDISACNYDGNAVYNDGTCEYISCFDNGCTNQEACNYDSEATSDDGSCEFVSCGGCTDFAANNYDSEATQDDGSCEYLGCTNPLACNYDITANLSNGMCDFTSCAGCMNPLACNYSPDFTISSPSSCSFPEEYIACSGECINDADLDGTCDELEIEGCTDPEADNYNNEATEDNGTCILQILGCTNPFACNYNSEANENDNSCDFEVCTGCTDVAACNFDESATVSNNGMCNYPSFAEDCDGNCLNDSDSDGVCNELEIPGCTDDLASNFLQFATENDGSCNYPSVCNDADACNYSAYEGYCISIEPYVVHDGSVGESDLTGFTTYRIYALCENESDFVSAVAGDEDFETKIYSTTSFFQHPVGSVLAESSNPLVFPFMPDAEFDSWVTIGLDGPASSGAEESGISILEGNVPWVEPFEAGGSLIMNDDLGGVWYILNGSSNGVAGDDLKVLLGQFTTDGILGGQMFVQFFENGDGVNGAFNKMIDLQDACSGPAEENCLYPQPLLNCEGNCLSDSDNDGVCDENEVTGCTSMEANNYNEDATDDDGSCDFTVDPCLLDVTAPYFTFVPSDSTILCSEPMPTTLAVAADDCDESVQVIFEDGPIEFILDCPPFNYLCTRTFYATDASGNVAEIQQLITVADTLAPEFLNLPADTLFINELDGEQIPEPFMAIQDACDSNADWVANDDLMSSDGTTALYQRTYTATDACGNISQWQQVISVLIILPGCTDALACNFEDSANSDDASCIYPEDYVDCAGTCLVDSDGDGVCDELEVMGCMAFNACNFSEVATDDDGSCEFCSCADEEVPVYGLEVDTVQVHVGGALDGMVTYRLYATTEHEEDFVSSVFGNDIDTLMMNSTTTWHQDELGALLPQNINIGILALFPDVAFDSWVTIGADAPMGAGENAVNTVGAPGDASWTAAFEAGENVVLDDAVGGAWFILNGGANGIAGEDLRVLVAQLTTDGDISGQLNVQIFEQGSNENTSIHSYTFEGSEWTNPESNVNLCGCTDDNALNFDPSAVYEDESCAYPTFGCTDASACNFDADSDLDDGSCDYAASELDCDGNCLLDSDGDGVCDAFEIFGCTDDLACNFAPEATEEDTMCIYADFALDCEGNCLVDSDEDGVCDENEFGGCMDSEALNFDSDATDDDGSCAYCSIVGNASVTTVSCNGGEDGLALITASDTYPVDSDVLYQLLPSGEFGSDSAFYNLSAGPYEIVAMDASGCADTVQFVVSEPQALQILLNEVIGSELGQADGSIEVEIIGGADGYTFMWSQLDNETFSSDEQNLEGLEPGTYQLYVVDANGCDAISFEITVESIVGIAEGAEATLSMYPNPASESVQLDWGVEARWSSLRAFDMQGNLVVEVSLDAIEWGMRLDLSGWAAGSYLIVLSGADHQSRMQLMKTH